MNQIEQLSANELMGIIAKQLRTLSGTDIKSQYMGKIIAQSKEVGNLAGKAIALSMFELEKSRIGKTSETLLTNTKHIIE